MALRPVIIIDSDEFSTTGQWEKVKGDQLYGGSMLVSQGSAPNDALTLGFYGSNLTIFGPVIPNDNATLAVNLTTIPEGPSNFSIHDIDTTSVVRLWSAVGLAPNEYNISISPSSVLAIDYATYAPYVPRSPAFRGKSIIVDDTDEELRYTGAWEKITGPGRFNGAVVPYGDTLSMTSTANSTLLYSFTGSRTTITGALNQQSGRLVVRYQVDQLRPQTITHFNGSQATDPSSWMINNQLFRRSFFGKGGKPDYSQHNISVTVLECSESQALYIDSISFISGSSTTLDPSTFFPFANWTADTETSGGFKRENLTIIGYVLGPLAGVLGLYLAWRFVKRRSKPQQMQTESQQNLNQLVTFSGRDTPGSIIWDHRATPVGWDRI